MPRNTKIKIKPFTSSERGDNKKEKNGDENGGGVGKYNKNSTLY